MEMRVVDRAHEESSVRRESDSHRLNGIMYLWKFKDPVGSLLLTTYIGQ